MKKEYIIPIFVPHLGCPNDCVFCNQVKISGQTTDVSKDDVRKTIEYYLENFEKDKDIYIEVAFFGGSFTGIEIAKQKELLETANEYIKDKRVNAIRISTRPDYIDKDILKMLKKYHVKTIELGVQSSNNDILNRAKRNHSFEDVIKASKLIRLHGFRLGLQMMVGLPDATEKDDIQTAKDLIKLKPKIVRIYPVLVIKGTELANEYRKETYTPLSVEQAVDRCKEIVKMFEKKKIKVIRVGLQNTDEITYPDVEGSSVLAGPYHPAFRQLVEDRLWYDSMLEKVKDVNVKTQKVEIIVNPSVVNNVVGHKKENLKKIKDLYDLDIIVKTNDKMKKEKFELREL